MKLLAALAILCSLACAQDFDILIRDAGSWMALAQHLTSET